MVEEPCHSDGDDDDSSDATLSGSPAMVARVLILLVRCYQVVLGPLLGGHCRFWPTCSEYSIQALRRHGAMRGLWLTIRRLSRCHPCGGHGFDPPP
ncbi:MAG: membrane protein insertion efficiency factor YidD [Phycisphaerales bacterium]